MLIKNKKVVKENDQELVEATFTQYLSNWCGSTQKYDLKLSVVILNRNRAGEVIDVYEQLKKQTFQDFNVIILDDNSESEDLELLKNIKDKKLFVYSYPSPFKFGIDFKVNYSLKIALSKNPEFIYTIHSDMTINNNDLLEKLVDCMDKNNSCGAVGPIIYNGNGIKTWGPGIVKVRMGKEYTNNETYMVRSKCYIEMDLINEKLIYYGTEYFTFNWLRNNGYSTKNISDVSVTHFGGGVSLGYQNSKDYYRPRTTILIMKLFCKEDSLYLKLKYFYQEMSEPLLKMKNNIKNVQIFKLLRTFIVMTAGTIAGLLINPEKK